MTKFFLATAAIILILSASQAKAQQATFRLPVEVHWGSAVLEPGEYRLSAPQATSTRIRVFYLHGHGTTRTALTATTATDPDLQSSYLQLVHVGDTYFVHEYVSAATGQRFIFAVPKTVQQEAKVTAQQTTVAVASN
jgi:hypothetical protein